MKVELDICRMDDDEALTLGQLIYHNYELLRVEQVGRLKSGRRRVRFYRIGKINLDREMSEAEREAADTDRRLAPEEKGR